jgi:hypothetical protein
MEMMMEVDPEATIHAIGKVLQTAKIEKRSNVIDSEAAAEFLLMRPEIRGRQAATDCGG